MFKRCSCGQTSIPPNFKRCGQMSIPPTLCRVARSPPPRQHEQHIGPQLAHHVTVLTWLADLVDVAPGAPSIRTCYSTHELLKRTGSVVTLGIVSCAVDGHNVVISHRNGIAKQICTGIGSDGRQHHEVLGLDYRVGSEGDRTGARHSNDEQAELPPRSTSVQVQRVYGLSGVGGAPDGSQ